MIWFVPINLAPSLHFRSKYLRNMKWTKTFSYKDVCEHFLNFYKTQKSSTSNCYINSFLFWTLEVFTIFPLPIFKFQRSLTYSDQFSMVFNVNTWFYLQNEIRHFKPSFVLFERTSCLRLRNLYQNLSFLDFEH